MWKWSTVQDGQPLWCMQWSGSDLLICCFRPLLANNPWLKMSSLHDSKIPCAYEMVKPRFSGLQLSFCMKCWTCKACKSPECTERSWWQWGVCDGAPQESLLRSLVSSHFDWIYNWVNFNYLSGKRASAEVIKAGSYLWKFGLEGKHFPVFCYFQNCIWILIWTHNLILTLCRHYILVEK